MPRHLPSPGLQLYLSSHLLCMYSKLGCNPTHSFLGPRPIEYNGTDRYVPIYMAVPFQIHVSSQIHESVDIGDASPHPTEGPENAF